MMQIVILLTPRSLHIPGVHDDFRLHISGVHDDFRVLIPGVHDDFRVLIPELPKRSSLLFTVMLLSVVYLLSTG